MGGAFTLLLVLAIVSAPLAGKAQTADTVRRIGILGHASTVSFEAGLRELGWVEGKNIKFERRVSADDVTLARFATELSRTPVDVIFAGNAPSTRAAMQATRAIPIITVSADPVSTDFVASLARPGGNVTGVAIQAPELTGKRLEILIQAFPAVRRVAFLVNPTNPSSSLQRAEAEARARALGVKLVPFAVSSRERVAKVMTGVAAERPDALVVQSDPLFLLIQKDLIDFAARHRLPAMWEWRGNVAAGGLMSYGANFAHRYRRAATYADRILRGARPGDLPVEQATTFELVINVKTAKALGLTIPQSMMLRADHVIE